MCKHLLAALILFALPAFAQQTNAQPGTQADSQSNSQTSSSVDSTEPPDYKPSVLFSDFFTDEYRMWSSPFRVNDYDAHTMFKYGLPFLAVSGALIATDERTTSAIPGTGSQTFVWSGRVSQMGAPYTLAAATATLFLVSKAAHEDHLAETGMLSLEALAHSQLIALGIKEISQRERPVDTTVPRAGFWDTGSSFPSGHATGSFAVATVFAYEYGGDHIAVPIVGFSLASVVAAARVSGRQHWVSDVFVGGALGFLEGRYIYKHHHDPDLPGSRVNRFARLIPAFDVGIDGGTLNWQF